MGQVVLPREATLPRVDHPVNLKGWVRKGEARTRIDHEINGWLQRGNGVWPGDPRMCLYANTIPTTEDPKGVWELWRLEWNGQYQLEGTYRGGQWLLGPDLFNHVVADFHRRDTRRGYDVLADIEQHEAARERRIDRDFSDYTQDFADTYLYPALKKAGLHRHAPTTTVGFH